MKRAYGVMRVGLVGALAVLGLVGLLILHSLQRTRATFRDSAARSVMDGIANHVVRTKQEGFDLEGIRISTNCSPSVIVMTGMGSQALSESIALDPWGNPYEYIETMAGVEVVSIGPDKIRNTRDDIRIERSWLPTKRASGSQRGR